MKPNRIRVAAGSIREVTDETLTFVAQMGCSGVILNTPALTGLTPFGSSPNRFHPLAESSSRGSAAPVGLPRTAPTPDPDRVLPASVRSY